MGNYSKSKMYYSAKHLLGIYYLFGMTRRLARTTVFLSLFPKMAHIAGRAELHSVADFEH